MTQSKPERRFSKLAAAINQKAARLGAPGRITATQLALLFEASGRKCAYDGTEVDWKGVSFDHMLAFAKGGPNTIDNLAVSCITCQRSKFTKTPEEWAQARVMTVRCEVCQTEFRPRWADWIRGLGRTCSRVCSGTKGGRQEKPLTA